MSQTLPSYADRVNNNRCVTQEGDIKIAYHTIINTTSRSRQLRTKLLGRSPQVELQKQPRRWWQRLVGTKAIAMAIAISLLPGSVVQASTDEIAIRTAKQLLAQALQSTAEQPANIDSKSPRQISLTLALETVAAILLLVGLLAAFLSNRAMRSGKPADAKDRFGAAKPESATLPLTTNQASFALDQALVPMSERAIADQQEAEADWAQLLTEITLRIRQSQSIEDLLRTTVKEVRRALRADRVIIYGLSPKNWDGTVVAESVTPGWPQILRVRIDDPCFRNLHVEKYQQGQVTAINDIYQEPRIADCYRRMLEQFAVKANLVTPIIKNDHLLGLLIAHQCASPRIWEHSDIDLFAQLAIQVGFAMDQVSFFEKQETEAERVQLITEITLRIRQPQFLEDLLKTAVKEVRRALKTDRVIILGLDPTNWDGIVVAESVAPGWPQTLRVRIDDPCLRDHHMEMYKNGRVTTINNIYQAPKVKDCYRRTLEQFAVKASLVAPILKNHQLLGLLIAHECSAPRTWQQPDIDLFKQLAVQIGFAVDRLSLIEQLESEELV